MEQLPNRQTGKGEVACNGDSRYSASATVAVVYCVHLLGKKKRYIVDDKPISSS